MQGKEEHFLFCRQEAQRRQELGLEPFAAKSSDHSRYLGPEDDHRLPYKRDVDRIIHSKAYSRYVHKTQVAYLILNDHISYRGLHVQLVSNFARGIAEILGLNLDLVEAIALGHDVGHPPFGHEGEEYLSQICVEEGLGPFCHPLQSCRLFQEIEPLNLGLAVVDGFLTHDGGLYGLKLEPQKGKTWQIHFQEREAKRQNPDIRLMPGTVEGCLVKLCDTVSYLGRDLEDGISLGLVKREEVPQTCLGVGLEVSNSSILKQVALDIIAQSYQKGYIAISESILQALQQLRQFNFERIYYHPALKTESKKIENGYRLLYDFLCSDLEKQKEQSILWQEFASSKGALYREKTAPKQMVVDYIAGMTDNFFIRSLERFFVPMRIELK